jgi:uncharacterized protein (TIGR03435 family)
MKLVAAGILFAALAASELGAQTFEVASVKPSNLGGGVRGGCRGVDSHYSPVQDEAPPPLGRCVIFDGRLGHIINIAFDLRSMQLVHGGPEWVTRGDDRFNIEAKADDPSKTTESQLRTMLQNLLVERFALKFHRETVERPGFALVVGKNGPKLRPAKGEDETTAFVGDPKPVKGHPAELRARRYTLARVADLLTQLAGGPVVNQTGLDGVYDFTLSWNDEDGPTLTTAVQEQLGLRLQAQKVPVSLFVIESAQKPSGN